MEEKGGEKNTGDLKNIIVKLEKKMNKKKYKIEK